MTPSPNDPLYNAQVKTALINLLKECMMELDVPLIQASGVMMLISRQSEAQVIKMARTLVDVGKRFELVLAEPVELVEHSPLADDAMTPLRLAR